MKIKRQSKSLITGFAALLILALAISFFPSSLLPEHCTKQKGKSTFVEKKLTILPLVVIGGIRYFRKAFEKKQQM